MSRIFELFGYPITDTSQEAEACRKAARCPFMGFHCDGGGNRPQSNINLKNSPRLAEYFADSGLKVVPSGVCSLQLGDGKMPWIVCPRRLLFLGKSGVENSSNRGNQSFAEQELLKYSSLKQDAPIGVWSELKMKYIEGGKSFDYTFDYILAPLTFASSDEIEHMTQYSWDRLRPMLESGGYTLSLRGGAYFVENFPAGNPVIVEIMTSSTSGGNKRNRTTIPMAFEDAILRGNHSGPSINYRQVWARMVSQLIVKSEVGLAWGGKTIWVLQDTLVDYIARSTGLDIWRFLAERTSEVNILSFSYGESYKNPSGVITLRQGELFSGPIQPATAKHEPSFQDMIRAPVKPQLATLLRHLVARAPANILQS